MRTPAIPFLWLLAITARGGPLAAQTLRPPVEYQVSARVNDRTGEVAGEVVIRYRHDGPDTLRTLALALGHQALRPGSRSWRPLAPSDTAALGFQHIDAAVLNDRAVTLEWPASPDSSTARIRLPEPLLAGQAAVLRLAWRTRPPALPWHMERQGRRVQLAGWYPLLLNEHAGTAVLEPYLGTHEVLLDLPADQVVAGTGECTCGDPGWGGGGTASECGVAPAGMRRVRWRAKLVTELVLAMSPNFRHEAGDFEKRAVHAFFEKRGEREWGGGLATGHVETALGWTAEILEQNGLPWPQTSIIEALPGSAGAYPMVLFAASPTQSTVAHLVGLMVTERLVLGGARHLTRGLAAFQTGWLFEILGVRGEYERLEHDILDWDLDGRTGSDEPLAVRSAFSPCAGTNCRRLEFMFHQLRRWSDQDSSLRKLFQATINRFMLQPIPAASFQQLSREFIQPDPAPLFAQLGRPGVRYDYALGDVRTAPRADGRWETRVAVLQRAEGVFPQTVWVIAEQDTAGQRAVRLVPAETLSIVTRSRPVRVLLDPLVESHDWNMLNNRYAFSARERWIALRRNATVDDYLDHYFSRRVARDGITRGWLPTAWPTDPAGWIIGLRAREDYLGRFEQNELWLGLGTRDRSIHARLRLQNPVRLRAEGWTESLDLLAAEGRTAAQFELGRRLPLPLADSGTRFVALRAGWLAATDQDYLPSGQYDPAGTAELSLLGDRTIRRGGIRWHWNGTLAGGYATPSAGSDFAATTYVRVSLDASLRAPLGPTVFGVRLFGGLAHAADSLPRQRLHFWSHADPWQQLGRPLLRSRGALLQGDDVPYHDPGGGGVRALDPGLASNGLVSASVELEYPLLHRPPGAVLRGGSIALFADGGYGDGDLARSGRWQGVADAGVSFRLEQCLGVTPFTTRLDLPLWLSRPGKARSDPGESRLRFRWVFSFAPSF